MMMVLSDIVTRRDSAKYTTRYQTTAEPGRRPDMADDPGVWKRPGGSAMIVGTGTDMVSDVIVQDDALTERGVAGLD